MREVPDEEYPEFIRRLREQARLDAEELVPRPGFPIYGLAEPSLTPAIVSETTRTNGEWALITLTYGRPEDSPAGPYVTVTTIALTMDDGEPAFAGMPTGTHGTGVEGELRFAVEREQDRAARWARVAQASAAQAGAAQADGTTSGEPVAEPVVVARETLQDGDALVARQGSVWAARLPAGEPRVAVTLVGRGVPPESVRLEQVPTLRPLIEARNAELFRRIERRRAMPPPPVPDLPPAEGAAALRALADFTLTAGTELRTASREPRYGPAWGGLHRALWQRAVAERRRLSGEDERTADDLVTSAVNHLGHLAEVPWFATDQRLREAAIDETVRHAMLDERVRSERAQYLWSRYWAAHLSLGGHRAAGDDAVRLAANRERYEADLRAAWEAWAASA